MREKSVEGVTAFVSRSRDLLKKCVSDLREFRDELDGYIEEAKDEECSCVFDALLKIESDISGTISVAEVSGRDANWQACRIEMHEKERLLVAMGPDDIVGIMPDELSGANDVEDMN